MIDVSLSARNLVKRYGGVTALADGNLEVKSGEVVALLGANGSGKSTLTKIITGVVSPDEGQMLLNGQPVRFTSPQSARQRGVTAVYQELSLIPDMTVAENIFLAHEPLSFGGWVKTREVHARTADLLALFAGTFSAALEPDAYIRALPPDERQLVEILKAYSQNPRLLILDEATASLDSRQVNRLFDLMQDWKSKGMALVFVSHRMEEIFRVGDRATVLRNGQSVGTVEMKDASEAQLVDMMIEGGVSAREFHRTNSALSEVVRLKVAGLKTHTIADISFDVRDGELLGIGGLHGQGQEDLLLALFGAVPYTGQVTLNNTAIHLGSPRQAMRQGVAFVPGDRGSEGLLLIRSIFENLQLPSWPRYGAPLRINQAKDDAHKVGVNLNLVMSSLDAPVSSLSGGNAQKVVIGKWLLRDPKLLLLNDPTKGIDVGAKGEFYRILADLRRAGTAILFYSSDDEELLGLCDRVLVMHDGRVETELSGSALTRTNLVSASMGAAHGSA